MLRSSWGRRRIERAAVVALAAAAGALVLALTLDRFATPGNLFALLRTSYAGWTSSHPLHLTAA